MNKLNILKSLCLSLVSFFVFGCASTKNLHKIKALPDQGPVRLELKPVVGAVDKTNYRSRSVSNTYTNGEISRKISEGVDFTVDTKVTQVDPLNKSGTYEVVTVDKDGKTDLSDFAMPELGESIEYKISADARILKAGDMPAGTIYFVPPISLPKGEVQVGDSWPMKAEWISLKSGIPLRMELVSILKNIRDCGQAGLCAEIEISGDVAIVGASDNVLSPKPLDGQELLVRFRSDIRGQVLLSINKGTVLYSLMRSDESLNGVNESVQISSCMLSFVTEPKSDSIWGGSAADCDPLGDLPIF